MDAGGRPHTIVVTARGEAMREAAEDSSAKESVSLDAKTAFPFGLYGRRRPGRTASSTAVPGVC